MNTKSCPKCKRELPMESEFCLHCMEKLAEEKTVVVTRQSKYRKNKNIITVLLCVALVIATAFSTVLIVDRFKEDSESTPPTENIVAWTMKLRPNGGIDSFNYCKEQKIVGFGWSLDGVPSTIREYRTMRTQEGKYPGDKWLDATLDSFENITSLENIQLLWTIDSGGYWYICEVTGGYQYSRDEAHDTAGMVNFAACKFYRIGTEDLVPEAVLETYNKEGVINYINDNQAIEATRLLWQIAKQKE